MKLPLFVGTGVVSGPFNGHPTLADNIIYYHKADTNGSYPDATGNGHTGTINGATYTASGKINGAYDYDGINDYITLVDDTDFDHTGAFTISCWVKFDTLGASRTIYRGDSNDQNLYYVGMTASDFMQFALFISGSAITVTSNSTLSTGTWYHIVVRRNSSNLCEMFINNVKQTDSATKSGTTNPTGTATYHIGSDRTGGINHDGIIDETVEWQRGLTDSEISDLYNSGSGLQY